MVKYYNHIDISYIEDYIQLRGIIMLDINDLDLETARKYKDAPALTCALDSALKISIMDNNRESALKILTLIKGMYGTGVHPFSKVLVKMAEKKWANMQFSNSDYMEMISDCKGHKEFISCVEIQLINATNEKNALKVNALINMLKNLYPGGCAINREIVKTALKVLI